MFGPRTDQDGNRDQKVASRWVDQWLGTDEKIRVWTGQWRAAGVRLIDFEGYEGLRFW
jgi:hypothetical protein